MSYALAISSAVGSPYGALGPRARCSHPRLSSTLCFKSSMPWWQGLKPYRPEANLPAAGHRDPLAGKKNFMYTVVSDGVIVHSPTLLPGWQG